MKTQFSQSGFSLIQGMMLAGVVAGSSLVGMRMLQDQKLSQRSAETRDQVDQVHRLIYSTLQDKDNCTTSLIQSATALNTTPTIKDKLGNVIVQTNTPYMNNNVMVQSMTFAVDGGGQNIGTLTIRYERSKAIETKRLKEGYGSKDIQKQIKVRIQRDPLVASLPYTSCYAYTGADTGSGELGNKDLNKTLCEELNSGESGVTTSLFIWDEATSTCKPRNNTCPPGQVNTGINSNGVVECRRLDQWMDTSKLFDPTNPSSCPANRTVTVSNVSGKIKITCSP